MKDVDILVVGVGGMGSAALYHLAQDGAAAVGLEQFQLGHTRGSSHGHTRVFRLRYHDPVYVHWAEAALPMWQSLERQAGRQLLNLCGMVWFGKAGTPAYAQSMASAEVTRQASRTTVEIFDGAELMRRFPVMRLSGDVVACWTPVAGFLDADECVHAHAELARQGGATIIEDAAVVGLDLHANRPVVEAGGERYSCRRLIVAAGAYTPDLLRELELPVHITRQDKFRFRPGNPAEVASDRLPVFADIDTDLYGFPNHVDLEIADGRYGPVTTAATIDRQLNVAERDREARWLAEFLPSTSFTFIDGITCMYAMTPDENFIVGISPKNPAVIVAAGFSGHGFKFCTLVGRILADLALTGSTTYPIERFRLDRFAAAGIAG